MKKKSVSTIKRVRKKPKYTKRALRLRREVLFSLLSIIFVSILIMKFHTSPTRYKVVVYTETLDMELIQYFTDFRVAKKEMQKQIEEGAYNPAILTEDDKILAIRYGIVNFRTKTCGENTSFIQESSQKKGYTNGCYGADGAYLETDDQANMVRFKLSGAVGWVNIDDIEIYNLHDTERVVSINRYTVHNNIISHSLTTDLTSAEQTSTIEIGENSIGLEEKLYYSYDGHYFYNDYPTMIDDYRKNTYENSINSQQPYYNYYQYLSHRSKTSYISKDINAYITNYLGYHSKPTSYPATKTQSQLYDEGYSFIDAQNMYGANAMMMLSLAINESGFGKSQIAIEKNNLFGHAAYDHAPGENANGYKDIAASISTHALIFLNQGYLNPCDQTEANSDPKPSTCLSNTASRFAGGFFGDKGSGMNVHYASDPYWGEKAALYYRQMDTFMGQKDLHRYTIKVLKQDKRNVSAYSQPSSNSTTLYLTPSYEHYAVIVLEEIEGEEVDGSTVWYKIQSEATLNTARNKLIPKPDTYATKHDIVYMPASYFQ